MNKKFFSMVGFIIILSMFVHAGWCASDEKEPIKIGLIAALSTPYGLSNKISIEISIEELNRQGGILGRPIRLVIEDWKREVPLAVAAYKKLVMSEKCLVVVSEGTEGTAACMVEAANLYPEYPHIQFAFWTALDDLTDNVCKQYDKYKFFFRIFPRSGDNYDPKLRYWTFWTEVIKTKKMALLIEEMGWTQPFIKGSPGKFPPLKEFLEQKGVNIVYYGKNSIGEKMFLPIFEKVAASGADLLYWVSGYSDHVTAAKQWADSAAKDIDISTQSGISNLASFWNMTGGAALGWSSLWAEVPIPFTEKSLPFLKELNKRGGGLISSTYGAYDGPWILKAAVEKVGNTKDVEALIKALETGQAQRGFWVWGFDRCHEVLKGSPNQPLIIGQFQENGKYVAVFNEEIRKITNPNEKFVPVKELRAKAGRK